MRLEELAPNPDRELVDRPSLGQAFLITASTAVFVNSIIRLLAIWLLDIDEGFEPLRFWPPVIASVVAAVIAVVTVLILDAVVDKPFTWFLRLALVGLLVSLVPAWTVEGAGTTESLVLSAMHLAAAASIIPTFYRYPRQNWV